MKTIPPVSAMLHYKVLSLTNKLNPKSIIDLGGVGRAQKFTSAKVTDINKTDGNDALALRFANKSFDASISVATIEHIGIDNIKQFFHEAFRVARLVSTHWLPLAPYALDVDALNARFGWKHASQTPTQDYVHNTVHNLVTAIKPGGARIEWFAGPSIREQLLHFTYMFDRWRTAEVYRYLDVNGDKPYGATLHVVMPR